MKRFTLILCGLFLVAATCVKAMPKGIGAVEEGDLAGPEVKAAAAYVMNAANTNYCNGLCASMRRTGELKLVEIVSAKTQVVAGTLYKLELLVEDTKGQQFLFTCTVWSRPWLEGSNQEGSDQATQITKFHYQYVDP